VNGKNNDLVSHQPLSQKKCFFVVNPRKLSLSLFSHQTGLPLLPALLPLMFLFSDLGLGAGGKKVRMRPDLLISKRMTEFIL
jgi:hypothetical protein